MLGHSSTKTLASTETNRSVLLLEKVCVKDTLNKRLEGGLTHLEVSIQLRGRLSLGWHISLIGVGGVLNPKGSQEIAVEMSAFCEDFKN